MPIAYPLRFKILHVGRGLISTRDRFQYVAWRLTGWDQLKQADIPLIGMHVAFPSGDRCVTGWLVPEDGTLKAAVLLFCGIGDQSANWRGVQQRLAAGGVQSLIFHYPGYGDNRAEASQANMEGDAQAAYGWLAGRLPEDTPLFLIGFSLGSGLAAAVASSLHPAPAGLILCEAFSTLREGAKRAARQLRPLGYLVPDVWRTRETVAGLRMPLYVIHSSGDRLFPVSMAEELYRAAREKGVNAEVKILDGYVHDAAYKKVPEEYWSAILGFIARVSKRSEG